MKPSLREEKKLWKKGFKRVVGLDESGRGSLAGPVVAAATLVSREIYGTLFHTAKFKIQNLRESKKLSPKKRERFFKIFTRMSQLEWGIGEVSAKIIDKINILEATKLAMKKAIKNLEKKLIKKYPKKDGLIDFLILDGNFKLNLNIPQKPIIKADQKVFSCAIASIIAKVWRDRIMKRYHKKYPQYGFDKHKGYPTKQHLKMIKKYGLCPIYRKSFKPKL